MARTKSFRKQNLTLIQQKYYMGVGYPEFRANLGKNSIEWIGAVTPTLMSDTYTVRIFYRIPKRPEVTVLSPELRLATGQEHLPHTFPPEWKRLCLHMAPDWNSEKPVSWLVPWISLWLYFYEVWRLTGEWFGEGHQPSETEDGEDV